MDALAIVLAAAHPGLWWYYALMATAGAVIGAFVAYRVALRGGKAAIEKEFGDKRFQTAHRYFQRMGFWSVFIGAIAPPPVPTSAFIMVAGALEYPWHRFLLAILSARLIRYFAITWVASRYGRQIFHFLGQYYGPALWTLVGIAIAGAITTLVYYLRVRSDEEGSATEPPEIRRRDRVRVSRFEVSRFHVSGFKFANDCKSEIFNLQSEMFHMQLRVK